MTPKYRVNARIWEPVPPMDRVIRYEDPLENILEERQMGVIAGEGYQSSDEQEVQFVDIDLELVNLDDALELVKQVLESAGAPAGSELRFEREGVEEAVSFGTIEGVAVYIDGQNLPDEVYEQWDIEELAEEIDAAMAGTGEIRGAWSGKEETALYLYGPSAGTIFSMLQPLLTRHPLCQNARVVIRHGNPAMNPTTVRIPFTGSAEGCDQSY